MPDSSNPPKHRVSKDKYKDVLEAWRRQANGRNFELTVEKTEEGDYLLSSLPFMVEEEEASDGEVWMATITVDIESDEFVKDEFIRRYYYEPVKKGIAAVKKSVTLLPYSGDSRTVFRLHASSIVGEGENDGKPTKRIRAAIDGFMIQLKKWLKADGNNDLCEEAERCLVTAIAEVG